MIVTIVGQTFDGKPSSALLMVASVKEEFPGCKEYTLSNGKVLTIRSKECVERLLKSAAKFGFDNELYKNPYRYLGIYNISSVEISE